MRRSDRFWLAILLIICLAGSFWQAAEGEEVECAKYRDSGATVAYFTEYTTDREANVTMIVHEMEICKRPLTPSEAWQTAK